MNVARQAKTPLQSIVFDIESNCIEKLKSTSKISIEFSITFLPYSDFELGLSHLKAGGIDVVFIATEADRIEWKQKFELLREHFPALPIVVLEMHPTKSASNDYLRLGAQDYLLKDFTSSDLERSLRTSIQYCESIQLTRMLSRIKNTEESLSKILNLCGDGILIANEEGSLQFINRVATDALDLKSEQMKVSNLIDSKAQGPRLIEIKRENTVRHFLSESSPIEWKGKQSLLCTLKDISDRVTLEKRKDYFLNVVSHDLRTPLTVIREGVSQIKDQLHGSTTEKQNRILDMVIKSVDRLNGMICDLLDIAKIEANKVQLQWNLEDLNEIIKTIAESSKILCEKKGLSLKTEIPEVPIFSYVGKSSLIQVLTNLIGNSLKFTSQGSVTIELRNREKEIEIIVTDTGPGIPKEFHSKLFQRFEQVEMKDATHKGTGLGLSIVKGLIELHHGKIGFQSEVGQGTSFFISLPKLNLEQVIEKVLKDKEGKWIVLYLEDPVLQNAPPSIEAMMHFESQVEKYYRRESDKSIRCEKGLCLLLPASEADEVIQRLKNQNIKISETKEYSVSDGKVNFIKEQNHG